MSNKTKQNGRVGDKMNSLVSLINKLDEYIKLLDEELNECAPIATDHGWRSTRIEAGKRFRSEIEALRNRANVPAHSRWNET